MKIAELRRAILKAFYFHVTGEKKHQTGWDYLGSDQIAELLPSSVSNEFLVRTLRIMSEAGQLEIFSGALVFRLTNEGLYDAEKVAKSRFYGAIVDCLLRSLNWGRQKFQSACPINWGMWGALAGIVAIPLAIALWWLS